MAKNRGNSQQALVEAQLNAWNGLLRYMIHDLTTPLVSIRMSAQAVSRLLPELAAPDSSLSLIPEKAEGGAATSLDSMLSKALPTIEAEVGEILKRFNGIKVYMEEFTQVVLHATEFISICTYVEELLRCYPFKDQGERARIRVNIAPDFKCKAMGRFMHDLLTNLVHNALFAIERAGKGHLEIFAEHGENMNILHVRDTGAGVLKDRLPEMFRRYFSLQGGEIRAGLGFCRLIFLYLGGDITCASVAGEYTDFSIKFPALIERA